MLEYFVPRVSTYAVHIDHLFDLITYLVGFWFLVAMGALFYFTIKFRRKEGVRAQYITGEKKEHKKWISYPHFAIIACDIVLIAAAVLVWYNIKQRLPVAEATVKVIGQQWAWTFVTPGPDEALNTADDITTADELHIKVNTIYHFLLESKDVLHSFSVPVFRLKQDAIPGRVITGWFEAIKTGKFDIQCAEMCGIGHGIMKGTLVIETPEEHAEWMASQIGVVANTTAGTK